MSLSTQESVKEGFRRAVRENLARTLKTPEDWDRFKSILRETDARLVMEQAAHARDYQQRIAEANEMILREENGVRLEEPLPPWVHKHSDADLLEHKAQARVQQDYDRRVAAIKKDELDGFQDLAAEIRARDAPTQAFNRAHDRSQDRSPQLSGPKRS